VTHYANTGEVSLDLENARSKKSGPQYLTVLLDPVQLGKKKKNDSLRNLKKGKGRIRNWSKTNC
jgi:hypothetical protein